MQHTVTTVGRFGTSDVKIGVFEIDNNELVPLGHDEDLGDDLRAAEVTAHLVAGRTYYVTLRAAWARSGELAVVLYN